MPPRIQSAFGRLRQWTSRLSQSQPRAEFSTNSPSAQLRTFGNNQNSGVNSQSARVMDLDSPSSSRRGFPQNKNGEGNHDALSSVLKLADRGSRRMATQDSKRTKMVEDLRARTSSDNYSRMWARSWKVGDVYAPHDLTPAEMKKWGKRVSNGTKTDIIDLTGVNPLDMYKNFSVVSEFMTTMGRIRHSKDTGLRPVNQRKVAKMIRRAIGLGIHPSIHRHPMILMKESRDGGARLL